MRILLKTDFQGLRKWHWKRTYREGKSISRFIACDIRRDVEIVDDSKVDFGEVTARVRTWNTLYYAKGIGTKPPIDDERRIEIRDLWKWDGEPWGSPVPDSTDRCR